MSAEAATAKRGKRSSFAENLANHTEIWTALGAIGLVFMLVMPMPNGVIDLCLLFNLALSLSVLLGTTYLTDPLEFSVFPSLLLAMALFRLALSLAVTRAILSNAEAGAVVDGFGGMVLGGNFVIGFVLFLTLLIVQFIVVTGGTTRIAEVVARFTLDAMPGKQMAIDADLNAGMITEDEARRRRRHVAAESDFYGAMDGASKFVKGDGIAALLVSAINILGGLAVGVIQMGMTAQEALGTYALLTVGAGLMIQIPGLLMSTASGLIVTRAASESNLSSQLLTQVTSRPETLLASAFGCLVLTVVPGLPKLPLLVLAGALYVLGQHARSLLEKGPVKSADELAEEEARALAQPVEDMRQHLPLDALELEVGYGLVPLAMKAEGGQLLERITGLRKQLALDLGLLVPPVRVRDNVTLDPNTYLLRLRGVEIAQGAILPRCLLALDSGSVADPIDGEHSFDPTFGLEAIWISPEQRGDAQRRGYVVIDSATVCVTHLGEAIRGHAPELLTRHELSQLLEVMRQEHPAIVDDLVPDVISRSTLQQVLHNLLDERVPVRDLVTILEALGEVGSRTDRLDDLTEYVRLKLARVVLQPLTVEGELPALLLDPQLERRLSDAIGETAFGAQLQLPPQLMQGFVDRLGTQIEEAAFDGHTPVVVCTARLRLPLRRLMKRFLDRLVVISYDEVAETTVRLQTLGMVRVEDE